MSLYSLQIADATTNSIHPRIAMDIKHKNSGVRRLLINNFHSGMRSFVSQTFLFPLFQYKPADD
jgi:hypothetical protein